MKNLDFTAVISIRVPTLTTKEEAENLLRIAIESYFELNWFNILSEEYNEQ